MSIRTYYRLTKPGIIYGNLLTSIAGFLLASKWRVDVRLFLAANAGVALIIAAACVINNYIDRDIDRRMARTKRRALVTGEVSSRSALLFASVLAIIGFVLLIAYVNVLTTSIGFVAFVDYVVLYGIGKRKSIHGTLIGSISGAAPIVAGYTAVTDRLDGGAWLLFLMLVLWQMPHFYAIAMYRFEDYKRAELPVWPVKRGFASTKIQIVAYIVAFTIASSLLSVFGYAGFIYRVCMLVLGAAWLWLAVRGFRSKDDAKWARQMFLVSLIVILGLSLAVAVGSVLP